MKRYLVFAGNDFYPLGGALDFIDDFDDINTAKKFAEDIHEKKSEGTYADDLGEIHTHSATIAWVHIFDTATKTVCYKISHAYPEAPILKIIDGWTRS